MRPLASKLTLFLAAGIIAVPAFAQSPTTPVMPPPGGPPPPPETRMTQPDEGPEAADDRHGDRGDHFGRKGGWDRRDGYGPRGGMAAHAGFMRLMFILADTDGDGALSLEEVQAVHARIFKAVDADGDGKATPEEIRSFFRSLQGGGRDRDRDDDEDDGG
jgi:hypothetical protein